MKKYTIPHPILIRKRPKNYHFCIFRYFFRIFGGHLGWGIFFRGGGGIFFLHFRDSGGFWALCHPRRIATEGTFHEFFIFEPLDCFAKFAAHCLSSSLWVKVQVLIFGGFRLGNPPNKATTPKLF